MTVAVVFPGQGSQSVGMLAELAAAEPIVGETFAEAHDVLGTDLWALAQAGPAEALADTRVTQPLMFVADIAVWRALRANGLAMPAAVAGHSLGEFAALVASNAIPFADALRLVERRATLMAGAVPEGEGGMAALIGMDDDAVVALCEETAAALGGDRVVEAVNFNAPGQVAISGHLDAIERAVGDAKGQGARKALVLPVSVPNHSSLMRGGEELRDDDRGDARGRLVEHQHRRAGHQSAPDGDLLALAAGELPGGLAALLGEDGEQRAHLLERRADVVAAQVGAHLEVLVDRQVREDVRALRDEGDAAGDARLRGEGADVLAGERDAPGRERQQPEQRLHRGGLARTVRPDHDGESRRRRARCSQPFEDQARPP